jgi:hypothetical protein
MARYVADLPFAGAQPPTSGVLVYFQIIAATLAIILDLSFVVSIDASSVLYIFVAFPWDLSH